LIVDTTDPGSEKIDLFDIFSEKVERDSDFTFSRGQARWRLSNNEYA